MCGPRGLRVQKLLYETEVMHFAYVTTKAHIDRTSGHFRIQCFYAGFDDDGWPDIYVACEQRAEHPLSQ